MTANRTVHISAYPDIKQYYLQFLTERICGEHFSSAWVAVSLTLKQRRKRIEGTWQKLTRLETSKCVRQLLKRINRTAYGSANRRYAKHLRVISIIEGGGGDKHMHVHLLLEVPQHMIAEYQLFQSWVVAEWMKLRWAKRQHHIGAPMCSREVPRWLNYILKDLPFNDECLDLTNTSI